MPAGISMSDEAVSVGAMRGGGARSQKAETKKGVSVKIAELAAKHLR
jgi:hypothetical protein